MKNLRGDINFGDGFERFIIYSAAHESDTLTFLNEFRVNYDEIVCQNEDVD